MGKLTLESYTKVGNVWLDKAIFFCVCDTIKEMNHINSVQNFVIILTDIERKDTFLEGTEPLYGVSLDFRQKIKTAKELNSDLTKESKILVLDDLTCVEEGLASEEENKMLFLLQQIMQKKHPYQIKLELRYYAAKSNAQFVLPIDRQKDLVYIIGKNALLNQINLN